MIKIKTGDTFELRCGFKASPTAPTSLDGYTITSMVKTSDGKRHVTTVTIDTPPSLKWFVRVDPADTITWASGVDEEDPKSFALWDCKVIKDGKVVHTETRDVRVITSITL